MSEKEIKVDKIESKKQRIEELIEKREEYVNKGEIDKEIEVLRELRILFKSVFGVESEENIKVLWNPKEEDFNKVIEADFFGLTDATLSTGETIKVPKN